MVFSIKQVAVSIVRGTDDFTYKNNFACFSFKSDSEFFSIRGTDDFRKIDFPLFCLLRYQYQTTDDSGTKALRKSISICVFLDGLEIKSLQRSGVSVKTNHGFSSSEALMI